MSREAIQHYPSPKRLMSYMLFCALRKKPNKTLFQIGARERLQLKVVKMACMVGSGGLVSRVRSSV